MKKIRSTSTTAFLKYSILIVLLAYLMSACASSSAPDLPQKKILFIGNSFTDFNNGLDNHLAGLAPNSQTARVSPGGYTLQDHWEDPYTMGSVRTGSWDVVVIQDQSQNPVTNYENFMDYAKKMVGEVRTAGGEPILFMTWERPDSVQYGVTTDALYKAYTTAGQELKVRVAPVGWAFFASLRERPDIQLNIEDGHPTPEGTYLAACIFYGVIYGQSPVDNPYGGDISEENRIFLQQMAARVLRLGK